MLSARETAAAFGAPMLEDEKPTPTAETIPIASRAAQGRSRKARSVGRGIRWLRSECIGA